MLQEWHKASLLELVLLPQVPYLAWTVFYYAKVLFVILKHILLSILLTSSLVSQIFIISSEKIKKRGYQVTRSSPYIYVLQTLFGNQFRVLQRSLLKVVAIFRSSCIQLDS